MEQLIWTGEFFDVATKNNSFECTTWPVIKDGMEYGRAFAGQRVHFVSERPYFGFMAEVVSIEDIVFNEGGTALGCSDRYCYFVTSKGETYKN